MNFDFEENVVIGRKNGKSLLTWWEDMYKMIYGTFPTYNELLEFVDDVLTDGCKVETETRILTFSIKKKGER